MKVWIKYKTNNIEPPIKDVRIYKGNIDSNSFSFKTSRLFIISETRTPINLISNLKKYEKNLLNL